MCDLQVLHQHHHLPEQQVKRLYRILHVYSLGLHQMLLEVCLHAADRQKLLRAVWKAFSQLWQDALQVCLLHAVLLFYLIAQMLVCSDVPSSDMLFIMWHVAPVLLEQNGAVDGRHVIHM